MMGLGEEEAEYEEGGTGGMGMAVEPESVVEAAIGAEDPTEREVGSLGGLVDDLDLDRVAPLAGAGPAGEDPKKQQGGGGGGEDGGDEVDRDGDSQALDDEGKREGEEDLAAEEEEAPEHACRYCGLHNPASVARCKKTGGWFCNSRQGTSASHMVYHLIKSKNKEVVLHKDSPLGETVLECYNCGCRNVFLLGFVRATQEDVVMMLCRDPCLHNKALDDAEWDLSQWEPIISDKAFLPWLVKEPTEHESLRARKLTMADVTRLEELWRTKPEATAEELNQPDEEEDPPQVLLRYDDAYHYQSVFQPLVKLESEYDRSTKESQTKEGINVRWERLGKGSIVANFVITQVKPSLNPSRPFPSVLRSHSRRWNPGPPRSLHSLDKAAEEMERRRGKLTGRFLHSHIIFLFCDLCCCCSTTWSCG